MVVVVCEQLMEIPLGKSEVGQDDVNILHHHCIFLSEESFPRLAHLPRADCLSLLVNLTVGVFFQASFRLVSCPPVGHWVLALTMRLLVSLAMDVFGDAFRVLHCNLQR